MDPQVVKLFSGTRLLLYWASWKPLRIDQKQHRLTIKRRKAGGSVVRSVVRRCSIKSAAIFAPIPSVTFS
jgi:hypothetical protein